MKAYMSLSCSGGNYNTVLTELLKLGIPVGDVFLLFGPLDMLIRLRNLESLDEFIEKWFNPVRMIGAEEGLITKTLSLVVISESPSSAEEPFAFVFLNTKPPDMEKVRTALLTIPEVLSADSVFGPYDIICSIRAKSQAELERVVSRVQENIAGIEGSITAIVAFTRVRHDIDSWGGFA
jgi:hypothetical protein